MPTPPDPQLFGLDTDPEAQEAQFAFWRRLGPEGRASLAAQMSDDVRTMAREGIRARHPDYTEAEAEFALRRMLLGDALFRAAWPLAPVLDP